MIARFIEWCAGTEPATPRQAALICAVVFGGMLIEFVLIAKMCARIGRRGK